MLIEIEKASLREVRPLRERYREEMNCQIVHDSWHERGFLQSYLISEAGRVVGYGSVGGVGDEPKDLLKEFFLLPDNRVASQALFQALVAASGAKRIESQTNDRLLTLMLLDSVEIVERDRILFEDAVTTSHVAPGAIFRPIGRRERKHVFAHEVEPVGDWVIELDGEVAATGGLMFHYNPPYSDIYMEVAAPLRGRGLGTFVVQELKRVSYEMGKAPAARCAASNIASRRTLQRAGMAPCAWVIGGRITT
jgi:RimJ/RimL family protein N-acetyltransferase